MTALTERRVETPPPPRRAPDRVLRRRLLSALTLAVLAFFWWLAASQGWVKPLFLPPPQDVLRKLVIVSSDGFMDATLLQHLAASLARVFAALLGALAIGIPLGLALGLSPVGRGLLDPLIELLRPLPPLAYLPLIVIWCGIGEPSKVLVIALAMLPPIALSTAFGVTSVAQNRVNAARALGAGRGQVIWLVVLPSALPHLLSGLRIALGAGWSTLVAAELIAATRGLGFMIQSAAQFLVTDVVILGILVIAAVAFALEALVRLLERAVVPWHGRV